MMESLQVFSLDNAAQMAAENDFKRRLSLSFSVA